MEKTNNQLKCFLICLKKSNIIISKPIRIIISGMIIGNVRLSARKNLFPYILSLGDNVNMNDVLIGACTGSHLEMAEYAISKGADNLDNNLNLGLQTACIYSRRKIVDLLISRGANCLNSGLIFADIYGRKEIVELLISKGINFKKN